MKRIIESLLILFLFFLLSNQNVLAEKIDSFDVNVVAQEDGSMIITELIDYNFEDLSRHGIFRYIPLYSKVGELYRIISIEDISVQRDGESEVFEISKNSEELNIKIGDPDKTITGLHNYLISYTVKNGIGSNFSTHDEIYLNATGNGWDVPIEEAMVTVSNNFGAEPTNTLCFTGQIGAQESDCSVEGNEVTTNEVLYPLEGLTAVFVYPRGTFPPSVLSQSPPESFAEKIFNFLFENILIIWGILNILLPILIFIWYQKRKNKKRFGEPFVNFDIPKDEKGKILTPALAGIIDSAKLEQDDVVATIFDLAIRRYLKIESIKKEKKFSPDKNLIKITRLRDSAGLNTFENRLFERLFRDGAEFVFLKDLKKDFYKTYQQLEKDAFKDLVNKKYFRKNPKAQRGAFVVFAVLSLITLNIILAITFFFLYKKLNGRTELGDEIDFRIDGLKLFLKSMDRNYKWQAENFYTVEKMIPYAVSLGYIDQYMKQLKIIKPDYNPSWYGGYRGSFFLAYGALNSGMSSNITTASPSSSGAGGGGFSGGGVGGGGGGSW